MTKDEALKLALKALRFARDDGYENEVSQEAITAIKQARSAPVQEPVACECSQGQVCHVCDPIIPSKQSAQQEPAFWYYTLVVEGQVVGENFTTVNWDTRVEPFGRYDIDHGGEVTKQPLYTTPPSQEFVCSTGLCHYKEQREWVGLDQDDIDKLKHMIDWTATWSYGKFACEIERILKEKNA